MIFDHFVPQLKDCSTHAKQLQSQKCTASLRQELYLCNLDLSDSLIYYIHTALLFQLVYDLSMTLRTFVALPLSSLPHPICLQIYLQS